MIIGRMNLTTLMKFHHGFELKLMNKKRLKKNHLEMVKKPRTKLRLKVVKVET